MKQVIFNVGGALSSYIEFDDKTLLVDVGKSSDFNPITDFLLPLYKKRDSVKGVNNSTKYHIDQLLISHPHKDHISAIEDFDSYFYPELLTTPNDNVGMPNGHNINWDLVGNEKDSSIIKLREMLVGRQPPLRATSDQNEFIYYIGPEEVENNSTLSTESYCNNISIVIFILINQYRVFLPGDIQKEGMIRIIDNNYWLKNKLKGGVDVLITPHHGLQSSFSTYLYDNMKENKTRCLHIISEKVNNPDEARDIDTRYSSTNFCMGENNLRGGNGTDKCYQVKTSRGHVYIDYSTQRNPTFEIISDVNSVIKKFL
jgi:Predicted hydrolase (metallo-beta-lactamase superfamily)